MNLKNKIFDSCVYPKDYSLSSIKKLSNLLKKNEIDKALCMSKPEVNLNTFFKNISHFDNLVPIASIKNKKKINIQLKDLKKIGYKFLKIHPRFLNLPVSENKNFYKSIFRLNEKYNLTILFCTLNSWEKQPEDLDLMNFIFNIAQKHKKQKIVLMHGGGIEVLKYYEIFRFSENIFFDLSYTFMHYQKTSIKSNFKFLMNKFDRRLIIGSDYPCFNFKNFKNTLVKNCIDISFKKKNNFLFKNIQSLCNE